MSDPAPSPVIVAYDLSHSGHAALERAIGIAKRAPWHVLHIVCVIDPRFGFPALPTEHVDTQYANRVVAAVTERVAVELGARPGQFFVHAPISKKAAPAILQLADEVGADLIVIGSKGLTGVERWMVGSTSERIVREAGCTVEVARVKRVKAA
jgi:nucleotide-binding universal stress UspA family protein